MFEGLGFLDCPYPSLLSVALKGLHPFPFPMNELCYEEVSQRTSETSYLLSQSMYVSLIRRETPCLEIM